MFFSLAPADSGQPTYRILADRIRSAVLDGRLAVATGLPSERDLATGLSLYAWKINRDWQKNNQAYLRKLAVETISAGLAGAQAVNPALVSPNGWTDASRRPAHCLAALPAG